MTRLRITSAIFLLLAACATPKVTEPPVSTPSTPGRTPMPATEARPVSETVHGVAITDPYRWLEDQDSPETRAWIDRQNAYTDAVLASRPEATRFAPRLEQLLNTDEYSTPRKGGERLFYLFRKVGEDLDSIHMREGDRDVRLIDPAPMSADHTTSVGITDVSPDGKAIAYYVRKGGADEVEIRFFDVDARREIGAPLTIGRYYGTSITPDRQTIYFTRMMPAGPRVFRRSLSGGAETVLFGEGYTREKILFNSVSEDGRYHLVHVFHGSAPKKTEIYIDDLRDEAPFKTVVNDLDFRSTAEIAGDAVVIQTNWNAPNDRVMVVSAADPGPANWREIVPENPKAAIQGTSNAGGRVYVSYLEDVKPRIIGYGIDGSRKEEIKFETLGNLASMSGTWGSPVAFFSFSSFHTPQTIYQYDVASGTRTIFARESAPVNPEDFVVEQVWYASKDGTRIPMFVLYKKGLVRNGTNPAWLTGYGGFTSSSLPSFSPRAIAWVEQGGVYAVPNLRGGGEFGEAWHQGGMRAVKQNTFDDFIAAGEYLIRERFTSTEHLGIAGGSNGGLLVMAVATQRPDLVDAVVCKYPLIDMVRYHKFLVGGYWTPEYGDPEKAEEFAWVYSYSPYHRVKQGTDYPATLFVTGDADTRVAPLHARKMTALLQAVDGDSDPILLRYHTAFGHSGGEPLSVQVKNMAEEMGFMWWQLTNGE